jgi:tetratricopeptide (TPR) repeat protein
VEYRQARDLLVEFVRSQPDVIEYRVELAGTCCNLGNQHFRLNQVRRCLDLHAQAIELLYVVRQRQPSHPTAREYLRNTHWARAVALETLGRHREAAADWEQASRLDDGSSRPYLHVQRALTLARAGEHAQAVGLAEQLARAGKLAEELVFDLARVYALSARTVAGAVERPLSQRDKQAAGHTRAALAMLERLRAGGFFRSRQSRERLDADTDLAFLRGRDDYQRFRAALDAISSSPGK